MNKPLPQSFSAGGFNVKLPRKSGHKRLMIGTEGVTNSGKSEFILSCPGPGMVICLDRNLEAMLDNPNPPPTRRSDFAFHVVQAPLNTAALKETYKEYWKSFYEKLKLVSENPDARTAAVDGDSDSWELQRLAEWGKLAGVGKSLVYAGVNAARRAMYARLHDSGKIVIATNKVSKHYKPIIKPDGSYLLGEDGKPVKEWDGVSMERQGFGDQDYLWHIQLRHLIDTSGGPTRWGLQILKAKAYPDLIGAELWDEDCCFESLVKNVYPNIDLKDWGL